MDVSQFLPIYNLRSPNIVWFLGAGASVSAGISTAWHMIWDFKRSLYCANQKIPLRHVQNLGDEVVRERLQRYFDLQGGYPEAEAEEEYTFYFEKLYPAPADRRRYIDKLVALGKPSYGHRVLASLMKLGKINMAFTTNFDKVIEDATFPLFQSSGHLVVSTLDTSSVAIEAMNEGRWPILAKLHGDFQSRHLKNTDSELQSQDAELRYALVEAGKRFGLAIVGHSGRDKSIMDALEDVLNDARPYPHGLFWFTRPGGMVFQRVTDFIGRAQTVGVDAHIIEVESFEELMSDLILLEDKIPAEIVEYLDKKPTRLSFASIPDGKSGWPLIRFNALNVISWPKTCRLVKCDIGGLSEVRDAIKTADANVIGVRRQAGVLAFGSDAEVRKAFEPYDITSFDLYSINDERLFYYTQEVGLIYEALAKAIDRERPVKVYKRRQQFFIVVDSDQLKNTLYEPLKKALSEIISGTVSGTDTDWAEAISIKLEYRLGRLWLLFEPTIWLENKNDNLPDETAKSFRTSRLASRYNRQWNNVLDGWSYLLTGGQDTNKLQTFGISDGIDASFEVANRTAFSKRSIG